MNSNLKKQLATWKVEPEIPRRFQSEVWAQIAIRESSRRSFWDQVTGWFEAGFCKPGLAAAVIALGLTLGVGVAYTKAQNSNELVGRQLESRYMASINPLAHLGASL